MEMKDVPTGTRSGPITVSLQKAPNSQKQRKNSLRCPDCNKEVSTRSSLIRHIALHSVKKMTFPCEVDSCSRIFRTIGHLNQHRQTHADERKFKCNVCFMLFKTRHRLNDHTRKHSNEKQFQCSDCGKMYKRKGTLMYHMKSHLAVKPFKCHVCGKMYRSKCELKVHYRMHSGETPYMCAECGKCFITRSLLKRHTTVRHNSNRKVYVCEKCGKQYVNKNSYHDHVAMHKGEEKIQCTQCDKTFHSQRGLASHIYVYHSGKERRSCSKCGKECLTQTKLEEHMRNHTGEKPFECTEQNCGKSFGTKTGLQRHIFLHTGEKPFVCIECDRKFTFKSHYNQHMKKHKFTNVYECTECNHTNNYISDLRKHILQVHLNMKWKKYFFRSADIDVRNKISSCIKKETKQSPSLPASSNSAVKELHIIHEITSPNPADSSHDVQIYIDNAYEAIQRSSINDQTLLETEVLNNCKSNISLVPTTGTPHFILIEDKKFLATPMTSSSLSSFVCSVDITEDGFSIPPNLLKEDIEYLQAEELSTNEFLIQPQLPEHVYTETVITSGDTNACEESVPVSETLIFPTDNLDSDAYIPASTYPESEENIEENTEATSSDIAIDKMTLSNECSQLLESSTQTNVFSEDDSLKEVTEDSILASYPKPYLTEVIYIEHPTKGTIKITKIRPIKVESEEMSDPQGGACEETILVSLLNPSNSNYAAEANVTKIKIKNDMEFISILKKMNITPSQTDSSQSQIFLCDECGKSYKNYSSLVIHMKVHTEQTNLFCTKCSESFPDEATFLLHNREHKPVKNHKCHNCEKAFRYPADLRIHLRTHTGEKPYMCSICGRLFTARANLRNHMRIHSKPQYDCNTCGKKFRSFSYLRDHVHIHKENATEYKCVHPDCGKIYFSKKSLTIHRRCHEGKKFICQVCDKGFMFQIKLDEHMRNHTGIKPYHCTLPDCKISLATKTGLERHMLLHSGEKNFICEICARAFFFQGHLNTHMSVHTREKKFWCSTCGKGFTRSGGLNKHLKMKNKCIRKQDTETVTLASQGLVELSSK